MSIEHGAFHNLRYLLAGCLMDIDERNIVAEILEEKEKVDAGKVEKAKDEVSILDKVAQKIISRDLTQKGRGDWKD